MSEEKCLHSKRAMTMAFDYVVSDEIGEEMAIRAEFVEWLKRVGVFILSVFVLGVLSALMIRSWWDL